METRVFRVDAARARRIVDHPEVKRRGEASYHDAATLGAGEGTIVVVRGERDLFELEVFEGLEDIEEGEQVLKQLADQEESSAMGVGAIFG